MYLNEIWLFESGIASIGYTAFALINSYNNFQRTNLKQYMHIVVAIYETIRYNERTICDCFQYRTKIDNDIFNKAVKVYAADEKKNPANLSEYAKTMQLYTKVMNIMERRRT